MTAPTAPPPTPRTRAARAVTEGLAPAVLVAVSLLVVGAASTTVLAGLGWGLLAAAFCAGIPMAVILAGVRRGRWSDHHVGRREQRYVPLTAAAASVVVGLLLLRVLDAPPEVSGLVVAMLTGLLVTLAVTTVWKVSVHAAVAAGVVVVLVVVAGPWLWLSAAAAAAVAWSRVVLGDHTLAQVLGGLVLGGTVAAVVFTALS